MLSRVDELISFMLWSCILIIMVILGLLSSRFSSLKFPVRNARIAFAHSSSKRTVLSFSSMPTFHQEKGAKYFEFQRLEKDIYNWWESSGYFKPRSGAQNSKGKFVVPMPPPNITGYLHMGHAIFIALQDIMIRYNRMIGRDTLWVPGTDHAGIATQLLVENELAKRGESRATIGREAFLGEVWSWKAEKGSYIMQQMRRLGASADWSREKFTLDPDMSAAVTEAFCRLHEKGLIYKGEYLVNWSPALQTAVSDLEVEFAEEQGSLFFFKYELAEGSGYLPVATTRPETILGDAAVFVHPNDERYKQYVGKMVKVPFCDRLVPDEYVDPAFGTGALKVTPAHDHNDYMLGKKHGLSAINVMNRDGSINQRGGVRYTGLDRFKCREKFWDDLQSAGLALKREPHWLRVPRNQRGGEVIEPLLSEQWFVRMEAMAGRAVQAVQDKQLTILPEHFEKTWYNWLENIHDWCVSRQLWWGHRIPVYYLISDPTKYVVARTAAEAHLRAVELYGPEARLVQDEDVLDTWFSSGLWPFATVGWPQDEGRLDSDLARYYPASVLETGYDILFFWVARMVTLGLELTNQLPFHTIYLHGLVRDASGQKMSKTKGNVIDPINTIEQYGADALRFSLVTGSTPGQDLPLSLEKIEASRNFVNKLWNLGKAVQAVSNAASPNGRRSVIDRSILSYPERYILAKCDATTHEATAHLEAMRFGEAGQVLQDFVWNNLADWFVEVAKLRHRNGDSQQAATSAVVLVLVWKTVLRCLHPFLPFVSEALWQLIREDNEAESISVADWPNPLLNEDAEACERFEVLRDTVRRVRNARSELGVEPGKKIAIVVRGSSSLCCGLREEGAVLAALCKCEEDIRFLSATDDPPSNALRLVVRGELDVFLPQGSLLDRNKELGRIERQRDRLASDLAVLEGRLANAAYRAKAPATLVKEVQAKADELRRQLVALQKCREDLDLH